MLRRSTFCAIVFSLAVLAAPAGARAASETDQRDVGPAVGTPIPHDLSATDQDGVARNFPSLKRKQGLLLLFSRSLGW